jgi:hypothetical protein
MARTIFDAFGSSLVLESGKNDWCRVTLILGGRALKLGAETRPLLFERLRRGLVDELSAPDGRSIDGIDVVWVLSLAEHHATLYAADRGEERILFVQAGDGSLVGRLVLYANDRRRWMAELTRTPTMP